MGEMTSTWDTQIMETAAMPQMAAPSKNGTMIIGNTIMDIRRAALRYAAIVGGTLERRWHQNSKTSALIWEMSPATLVAKSEDCFCRSIAYRVLLLSECYIREEYVFFPLCRVKVATTHST